jgi:uncharacterized protein
MHELTDPKQIAELLKQAKTIAVVGFHPDAAKPAHYVPEYLQRRGYRIIPVNPSLAERKESFWGVRAVRTLAEIQENVDVVEIFRRSERVHEHLEDILAMLHRPRWVWLQLGIRNDEMAKTLLEQGINVVQDRCMLSEHRHLL